LNPPSLQAQPLPPTESKIKISGEVLFGTAGYGGVNQIDRANSQVVFDNRVRFNIETKFTPDDRFKVRLETGNSTPLNTSVTGTNMTRLGYDGTKGNVNLSLLHYQFPISDRTQAIVEITGSGYSDNLDNFSPLANSSTGSMSRFGRYQPIYRLSNDGSGITLKHQFSPHWSASGSYTAPSLIAANPSNGGFFSGANAVIGQVKYEPSKDLKFGITYARSYHPNGSGITGATGSLTANNPFDEPTTAQHYGLNASHQIGQDVTISGWWGLTEARSTTSALTSQSTNYAVSIAANNVGAPGNTLGIIVGVPPKSDRDRDTSLHLETIYKFKINDNIDITPGLLVITNPEHDRNNSSIWVGTIRTTFRF
uniref:iron uptake porin n=1 Tax=Chamaesiphon sp. VAR_48_metabat_403 TaxID=2964700 RepID=UPI00286E9B44